ncbi:MAG TPA: BON domain-containing protein [Candidatus Saccharimonadales bacterium]|nr:BON domain-containing protein [Candidatus Saccharimonadales bacterium]
MKNPEKYLLATTLLILPLGLGCQTSRNDAITVEIPTVETAQDAALSKSVQDQLRADKKVDLTGIKVISSNGTVYLNGTVKSLDARQQAIKIAWEVRGVQSVVSRLEVQN